MLGKSFKISWVFNMKVTLTNKTYLKAAPIQSDALKDQKELDPLIPMGKGTILQVLHQEPCSDSIAGAGDHLFVQLHRPPKGHKESRWFIFAEHCCVEGTEPTNNPAQSEAFFPKKKPEIKIKVPGITQLVGVDQPIYEGSHFAWGELTKGGSRIPVDRHVTDRLVKLAKYMDKVRAYLGDKPIRITSGYRDPATNRAVGGASSSRHMSGDAVDFYVEGLDVVSVFHKLKGFHPSGGLAVGSGFVHLDLRPYPSRWSYPGGPRVALW